MYCVGFNGAKVKYLIIILVSSSVTAKGVFFLFV